MYLLTPGPLTASCHAGRENGSLLCGLGSPRRNEAAEAGQRERGCSAAEDARCPSWEICVGSRRNIPGGHLGVWELGGGNGTA